MKALVSADLMFAIVKLFRSLLEMFRQEARGKNKTGFIKKFGIARNRLCVPFMLCFRLCVPFEVFISLSREGLKFKFSDHQTI